MRTWLTPAPCWLSARASVQCWFAASPLSRPFASSFSASVFIRFLSFERFLASLSSTRPRLRLSPLRSDGPLSILPRDVRGSRSRLFFFFFSFSRTCIFFVSFERFELLLEQLVVQVGVGPFRLGFCRVSQQLSKLHVGRERWEGSYDPLFLSFSYRNPLCVFDSCLRDRRTVRLMVCEADRIDGFLPWLRRVAYGDGKGHVGHGSHPFRMGRER